jgi:hypothetical protein
MSEEAAPERIAVPWSPEARAHLRGIDRETAIQILNCVDRYLGSRTGDVKKLKPPYTGFRLRCGDYRVSLISRTTNLSRSPPSAIAKTLTAERRQPAKRGNDGGWINAGEHQSGHQLNLRRVPIATRRHPNATKVIRPQRLKGLPGSFRSSSLSFPQRRFHVVMTLSPTEKSVGDHDPNENTDKIGSRFIGTGDRQPPADATNRDYCGGAYGAEFLL